MRMGVFWIALLLFSGLAQAVTLDPIVVGECNACGSAQLRSKAVTVSNLHEQAEEVYLLDVDNRIVYRYSVQTHDDYAQWSVVVTALPTDTPAADHIRAYWYALDHAPRDVVLPEESYGTPTRWAADLLNAAARWNAVHMAATLYNQQFQLSPNVTSATYFVNQYVAPVVNLSRPVVVTVRLNSGAQFKVRITPVVNDQGGTEFLSEFVEGSLAGADGTAIPMARDGYAGYSYRGDNSQTVFDLIQVLQRLGVPVVNAAAASSGGTVAIACSTVDGQQVCSVKKF